MENNSSNPNNPRSANPVPPAGANASDSAQQPVQVPASQVPHTPKPIYNQTTSGHPAQHAGGYVPSATSPITPPMASKAAKAPGGAKTFLLAFAGAALAVIIGLGGFGIYTAATGSSPGASTTLGGSETSTINVTNEDADLAETVAAKALPSVVAIDVYVNQSAQGMFGPTANGAATESTQAGLGSGVVISKDGYILTNNHVIEGSDRLTVTAQGQEYEAKIVGADASSDVAVLKIDAKDLTAVEIGTSSDLTVGEWVMTLGSPFGLEQSVATGIVSATSRSATLDGQSGTSFYTNMIQTDAAINPGNSGGALVDKDGKLIGINTMVTSYSGTYSGVGFAIPVDYAMGLAQQIIDGKTPTHAQLGVSTATVDAATAKRYGFPVNAGAYISSVVADSAAGKAGLQEGDIITKFNATPITSADELILAIRAINPGDKATLEVNRDGESKTMEVTMGSDANSASTGSSSGNKGK
ncbi:MAG: trypsin-like peptidase domain-containing protein [Raoultibacter sp.]